MRRLHVLGYNADVDIATAPEDVSEAGAIQAAAAATNIVSSDAADDAGSTGVEQVLVIGIDADYKFISEVVVMNGTTQVALVNTYLDIYHMEAVVVGSGGVAAGLISVRHTTTVIASIILGNTVSKTGRVVGNYKLPTVINQVGVHITDATAGTVRFELQTKLPSGGWVTRWTYTIHGVNEPSKEHVFADGLVLQAGEYAKMVAVAASVDNTVVEAYIEASVTSGSIPV